MKYDCSKEEDINKIKKEIKSQKQLGEKTFSKVEKVEKSLQTHRDAQQRHEKELARFMKNTNAVMDVVNGKLLPAYNKEQKAVIAKEWIKEQAVSGKFWISIVVSIAAFLGILSWWVRQVK